MNEIKDSEDTPQAGREQDAPEAPRGEATSPRGGRLAVTLALGLGLLACAGVAYLWWQQRLDAAANLAADVPLGELRVALEAAQSRLQTLDADLQTLSETTGALQNDAQRQTAERTGLNRSLSAVETDVRQQLQGVERRLSQLESGVSTLSRQEAGSRRQMALIEAGYMMRLAQARLLIFRDPVGSAHALRLAQAQLQALGDPALNTVHDALTEARQRLDRLELPDWGHLAERLLSLAMASREWPLAQHRERSLAGANAASPESPGWWSRFTAALSEVVMVRRETNADGALLRVDEERLLRENVRLQLLIAQLSALRGDQVAFDSSMQTVLAWLNRYYDLQATVVEDSRTLLIDLATTVLNPALPDIAAPWIELRNLMQTAALSQDQAKP